MGIIGLVRIALLSPVIALALTCGVVMATRKSAVRRPPIQVLAFRTLIYAVVGAGLSLAGTVASMVWYEYTTGYSAGNGPIGWIFFYGPLSAAVGEIVALVHWWTQRRVTSDD